MPPKAKPVKKAMRSIGRKRLLEDEDSDPMEMGSNSNLNSNLISRSVGNPLGSNGLSLGDSNPELRIAAPQDHWNKFLLLN